MLQKINCKQCIRARALLKWNIYDLVNRSGVLHGRLLNFEKGKSPLHQGENDAVVKVFTKAGIVFSINSEVRLEDKKDRVEKHQTELTKIILDASDMATLSGTNPYQGGQPSADGTQPPLPPLPQSKFWNPTD